jgi:hypothetical protein
MAAPNLPSRVRADGGLDRGVFQYLVDVRCKMASDQRFWVPWSTAADLMRAAAAQGTPVTERLIVDWTERGLLDQPRSRGLGQARGRERGAWPWNQRILFLILLQKRPAKRSQFPALFNIPVFIWLGWDESYVPLRQARRCLLSWHRRLGRTFEKDARHAARKTVRDVAHSDASRAAKKTLAEHLEMWAVERTVHPDDLRRLLQPVVDPHRTGQPRGPRDAPFTAESYLGRIEARILGEVHLTTFDEKAFRHALSIYRQSRRDYLQNWKRLSRDSDLGHMFGEPTADQVANSACVDLTTILGLLKKGGVQREGE